MRARIIVADPRPLLKWAGSKSSVFPSLLPFFPERCSTFYDCFTGSGAVFFKLYPLRRFDRARLSDINEEVVTLLRVAKDRPATLAKLLDEHSASSSARYFKAQRDIGPLFLTGLSPEQRAARTVYLNKTCFNGLYRQNAKGEFNVSFGKKGPDPSLYTAENIDAVSRALSAVDSIDCMDFEMSLERARRGDFAYLDPPYCETFAQYHRKGFDETAHARLAETAIRLATRGVRVVISNSDCELTEQIYSAKHFEHHRITARRSISRDGDGRASVSELVLVAKPGKP